jgi:hypothetical protein
MLQENGYSEIIEKLHVSRHHQIALQMVTVPYNLAKWTKTNVFNDKEWPFRVYCEWSCFQEYCYVKYDGEMCLSNDQSLANLWIIFIIRNWNENLCDYKELYRPWSEFKLYILSHFKRFSPPSSVLLMWCSKDFLVLKGMRNEIVNMKFLISLWKAFCFDYYYWNLILDIEEALFKHFSLGYVMRSKKYTRIIDL